MQLKVQLLNEVLGPLVATPDPIGINELSKTIKKSAEHDGVTFEIILDLKFIKNSREYIKMAYETAGGIDALVKVNVFRRNTNEKVWKIWATGQVNYNGYDIDEEKVSAKLEQVGIERYILNHLDTDVNLETGETKDGSALTPLVPLNIPFHSKKIKLQFAGIGKEEESTLVSVGSMSQDQYIQFPFATTYDEIEERQDYPLGFSAFLPEEISKYNWRVETGGVYTISIPKLTALIVASGVDPTFNWTFKFTLVTGKPENYTTTVIYTETKNIANSFDVNTSHSSEVTLEAGDEIYLYGHLHVEFFIPTINYRSYTFDGIVVEKTIVNIEAATTFDSTDVKAVLLHEAFERCCQYLTGETVCFYSELLGRTDIDYAVDGDASLIAWTNGHRLRGNNGKHIFASLKELIEFVNARFCVGYGFETVDDDGELIGTTGLGLVPGTKVFRVESKDHFYQKNTNVISLGRVYNVRKRLDSKRYYNLFEYGYKTKVDIEQINAIDEFMTYRKDIIPIVNTKNKLQVYTEVLAGGYQIECQRRLTSSTEDGKHDDDNFVVNVIRDGSDFRTRTGTLADGFIQESFENIYDPQTGYNYYLSPGRCKIAWKKVIAACLIRSRSKVVKFSSGEGNYQLKSQMVDEDAIISEDGNTDLTSTEPDYDPEIYSFAGELTLAQTELIEANPLGYFDFEDRLGITMNGFINADNGVDIEPDGKTMFELLKVHRPTV